MPLFTENCPTRVRERERIAESHLVSGLCLLRHSHGLVIVTARTLPHVSDLTGVEQRLCSRCLQSHEHSHVEIDHQTQHRCDGSSVSLGSQRHIAQDDTNGHLVTEPALHRHCPVLAIADLNNVKRTNKEAHRGLPQESLHRGSSDQWLSPAAALRLSRIVRSCP